MVANNLPVVFKAKKGRVNERLFAVLLRN